MFCWTRDKTIWNSAWMTSAQLWSRRHHWPWADVIRADFQTVIYRYLHNVNTRIFCTADTMFRTIIMQNSRLVYACFPIKIDEVWIDRFYVRNDWWRRLQRTTSVSPVCLTIASGLSWQCRLVNDDIPFPLMNVTQLLLHVRFGATPASLETKKQRNGCFPLCQVYKYYHFKLDFQKVNQHTRGNCLIDGTRRYRDN